MNTTAIRSRWTSLALAIALVPALARAQSTERVSLDSAGLQGNGTSGDFYRSIAISYDGRFVAFKSLASNLVPGDTNGFEDIFLRDRLAGTTECVSVNPSGLPGNGRSRFPSISADGRYVAFASSSSDLVAGDQAGNWDIFVRDRQLGTTTRASVGLAGAEANADSSQPSISANGRFVAFASAASNLMPFFPAWYMEIYVRDLVNGTTTLASQGSGIGAMYEDDNSDEPAISGDGSFVAFTSDATNLVPGDTNGSVDVFVRDRFSNATTRVNLGPGGVQAQPFSYSYNPALSADGRFVVFDSSASNLTASDTNTSTDVYLRDRQTGTTELVSLTSAGLQPNGDCSYPSISASGRFIAFQSSAADLVPGDLNGQPDIFLRDRLNGTTERVNLAAGGVQADFGSFVPVCSGEGRCVEFSSLATNLVAGDTNGSMDVFVAARGAPQVLPFCIGEVLAAACPCGNTGLAGRGCENSASTGGAQLSDTGSASLASDSLVLTSSGELPTVLSLLLQGATWTLGSAFGDGRLCMGGTLQRLYTHNAAAGSVTFPQAGDLSISTRSAALGDLLSAGSTRYYQTYYRDPVLTFCPSPQGNSWNISSGLAVVWSQ